ncbi:hypothetical protein [Flavobacterium phycosphaerae]|uniref:hypothetical protein n=1 Tax=Flavobacterium phycosphaerae TaxID=2697515 RepID=UPI00138ABB72|nr:hypothetical protein [Flavobacterium phycosphaerae]
MKLHVSIFIISFFLLTSCIERRTSAAKETYEYWAGTAPDDNTKILNGSYWQSPHWTKEYEVYLEIKTSSTWISEFIKQNKLKVKTSEAINLPEDAPDWFKPRTGLKVYEPSGFSQGSIYFTDEKKGYIMFYEIQL